MAKKKVSDTIKQQRYAQEEFLKLKKMESGEIPTEPKYSEEEIKPKSFGEKVSNFWFYYKWVIISVISLAVVLAICISQCAGKKNYDMKIVLFSNENYIPDDTTDYIAEYFEKLCPDVNGDKKFSVEIINCSFSSKSDTQTINSMKLRIQNMIAAEESAVLYITDEAGLKYLRGISSDIFTENSLNLGKDFYDSCDKSGFSKLPENLILSCRDTEKSLIGKSAKSKKIFSAAQEIIKKIGETNNEDQTQS